MSRATASGTFGEPGPYDWYTSFTVDDAIYVGRFDGGPVGEILTVSDTVDSPIFVQTEEKLHAVTADGTGTESVPLPESFQSVVADGLESVVDTTESIYAVALE